MYSALQRAHKAVEERLPEQSQQETLRALGDEDLRKIVDGYVDAWERNDVEAVAAMLAEDATLAMPPIPTWFRGREAVSAFLARGPLAGGHVAHHVVVITLEGSRVGEMTAFMLPDVLPYFGLPAQISS